MGRDIPSSERRDRLYAEATAALAPALARLSHAIERDPERARDLEQDIHLALWRSLDGFAGECALATWTYRVAHNVAADHAARGTRSATLIGLDAIAEMPASDDPEHAADTALTLDRLHALIARLTPADRSLMLLYLEGIGTAQIGEIVGLNPNHVGVKVHRLKALLARRFQPGDQP